MAFEKFENRNVRTEERITLTKSESIGFPSKFYHENNVQDFKYAVLFWNVDSKEIGIKFTNDETEKKSGFVIARSKQGYGGSVSVRSFFRHYKIDPKMYHGRYEWRKETQEGLGDLFIIKIVARQ